MGVEPVSKTIGPRCSEHRYSFVQRIACVCAGAIDVDVESSAYYRGKQHEHGCDRYHKLQRNFDCNWYGHHGDRKQGFERYWNDVKFLDHYV